MLRFRFLFFFLWTCLQFSQAQDIDSLIIATIDKAEELRKLEGKYDEAIKILMPLSNKYDNETSSNGIAYAKLNHKIGLNYWRLGKLEQAHIYASKALNIRLNKYGKVHIDVARTYILLGVINKDNQNYRAAKKNTNQAVLSMETLINTKLSIDTLRLIRMYDENIRLYSVLKDITKALQYWQKSYSYYSKNEDRYRFQIALLFESKGTIYLNHQSYHLAEKAYQKAFDMLKLSKNHTNYDGSLARIHANLANVQNKLKKHKKAMANNLVAINLYEQLIQENNFPELHQKLSIVYSNQVEFASYIKKYQLAQEYFLKSLSHNQIGWESDYNSANAELYRNRTMISFNQKNYKEALGFNQKSLHSLTPTFKNSNFFDLVNLNKHPIKDKISFFETLKQKASILTALYNKNQDQQHLQAAFQNYQTLDTVITQIRQSYNAVGSQFELIEQSYPIYEKAINAALTLYEKTKKNHYLEAAYHFAAKNKALVLLGGIQDEQAKSYSSIPTELLDQEKDLKRSIFQLESELYDLGEKGSAQLKDSLFTLRRDYQKLIDKFEVEHTDYYESKYSFDKNISIVTLQKKLSKGAAIIEYFVGDNQIFIFTISKKSFDYIAIDKPTDFEQTTTVFRQQLDSQSSLDNTFFQQSFQLFNYLLKASLAKLEGINHLIIIPDGILMQLPFDVLLQEENTSIPKYLIRGYSISYAYSNQLLFGQKKQNKATRIFAGFGLEYDQYTLDDLEGYMVDTPIASLPLSRALGKLQYSDDEIREIAKLLDGDQWLNADATRNAFLNNAAQYAILHLATHGILNEEYPMNSALVFTRQNDSTEYFLRAADLYNMKFNADMVVLSACNTGAGIVKKGEGVRSLARAFSYAGCPSMVASLWNASDQSTKNILVLFYKNLTEGMTKSEAMRQAKLSYLDTTSPAYQSPYFWSHLTVIGDSGKLEALIPLWRKHWFLGMIGLFLIAAVTVYRRTQAAV